MAWVIFKVNFIYKPDSRKLSPNYRKTTLRNKITLKSSYRDDFTKNFPLLKIFCYQGITAQFSGFFSPERLPASENMSTPTMYDL